MIYRVEFDLKGCIGINVLNVENREEAVNQAMKLLEEWGHEEIGKCLCDVEVTQCAPLIPRGEEIWK